MSQCFAITRTTRAQCTARGLEQGLCKTHAKMAEWQEERIRRATQNIVHEAPELVPGPAVLGPVVNATVVPTIVHPVVRPVIQRPPTIDLALVEAARQQRIAEERRDAQVQKIQNLMQFSPNRIVRIANDLADFWIANRIPGYDLIKAHCALKHMTSHHHGFEALLRASVQVLFLSRENDPQNRAYTEIRPEESAPLFAALSAALVPYGPIRMTHYLTATDRYRQPLLQRRRVDELAERRRLEEEVARQAQHQENLRQRAVVFRRDPKGGVDLAQMATDQESVHRESVQTTTERAINILLVRPIPSDQDAYSEILAEFNTSTRVAWASANAKQAFLHEFAQDYLDGMAFGIRYGQVVDHVWAYIRTHDHRADLVYRLLQELNDGRGSCVNGKMARLINTLQGYDDTVTMPPPREVFQIQIERLRSIPVEERSSQARRLFEEYQIPGEEQAPWLEALEVA